MLKEEHIETIITLHNEGLSLPKIAEYLNMKRFQPIAQFLEFNGIRAIVNRDAYFDNRRISDKLDKFLILKLINDKKTRKEMAVICNTTESNIKRFLKRNGIRMVKYETLNYRNELMQHKDEIIYFYENCKSLRKVAEKYNCSPNVIRDFFRSINYSHKANNYIDLTNDLENIKNFYYNEDKNLSDIGRIYNCSSVKIRQFLLSNNCILKDKNAVLKKLIGSESFQRKCLSGLGRKKDYILPSGAMIRLRGYEPQFLDYIFNNNILDENEIDFQPERINYIHDGTSHHYYPDFYIQKYNLIVEIKSKWILKKQGVDKNKSKKLYTDKAGYNFIMILDNDFNEFDCIISTANKYKYLYEFQKFL